MLLKCDGVNGCEKEFTLEKVEVDKLDNEIEKNYFRCPYCNTEYVAFYTNKEIRKKQKFVRSAAGLKKFEKVKKEIERDMEKLKKKVEASN